MRQLFFLKKTKAKVKYQPLPLLLKGGNFQSQILKTSGDQKKMSDHDKLKSSSHRHLHGEITMFLVKKDFGKHNMLRGLNFKR